MLRCSTLVKVLGIFALGSMAATGSAQGLGVTRAESGYAEHKSLTLTPPPHIHPANQGIFVELQAELSGAYSVGLWRREQANERGLSEPFRPNGTIGARTPWSPRRPRWA
jgi:hypothetical protein